MCDEQFSSYPGILSSTDDYFQTSAGLVATETTLELFNTSMYSVVRPDGGVLSWSRAVVANRLSASGAAWHATMGRCVRAGAGRLC